MNKFKNWLSNAPIQKKFVPLQWFIIICVAFISIFSSFSVAMVDISSENIINDNVRNKEQLSAIIRNMYVCRVLGRDILLHEDIDIRDELYAEYITAFDDLDYKMDSFATQLSGAQLTEFNRIIEEKNIYKESMILSADIWIGGGDYEDALYALQVVTPIANEFFGSIDDYSAQEELLLNQALESNHNLVLIILVTGATINILLITAVILFTRFFSKNMSTSLVTLEKSMSKIAETGNMKIEIPSELYTKDEIGRIASVSNNMKTMLLEYSFNDTLTGGLNAKAYHEELNDLFLNDDSLKDIWCVIADMNNLKLINDVLGHMEGDNAIRSAYHSLNNGFKHYGKTFRVGGDEFVSILSGCSFEEISDIISNISIQIEKLTSGAEIKFSLAFGYDNFTKNTLEEFNEFFKSVDKKMYDDKAQSKQSRISSRILEENHQENSLT